MPLEQIGNALTFEAFYTDSGSGATGLTVTVDVWELTAGGVATEIVAGGAATEIGDGLYYYQLAAGSVDAEAIYTAVFKCAGTVDQAHIVAGWVVGPTWVENVDAASSTLATAIALATAQADLDNPSQYMADVSALATSVEIAALNDITVAEMLAGIIEGALDLQEVLRIILSFVAGTTTGGNTTNPIFKSQDGGTDRIDMTVDSDGDRSSVTVDGS